MNIEAFFDKDMTAVLKGIAILFMIMHHCLIPDFYDYPPDFLHNGLIVHVMMGMKICVGLFTFIIGYGYAFCSKRTLSYGFKHIRTLVVKYWILLFLIFIPVAVSEGYHLDIDDVVLEMFGLKWNLNCASWYVSFYIFIMILLPLIANIIDKNEVKNSVLLILLCGIVATFLGLFKNVFADAFQRCFFYLPLVIVGYVVAKLNLLNKIAIRNKHLVYLLLFIVIGVRCAVSALKGFSLDILCVPLFIYCVTVVFKNLSLRSLKGLLSSLGKVSLYMWFLHAVFYSVAVRSAFAKYILWPNNLLVSFMLVVILSYLIFLLICVSR